MLDYTLLRAWASHSALEQIDGIHDDPSPPSSGNRWGSSPAKGKKRALAEAVGRAWRNHYGDFSGLLLSTQTHRSGSDGEARLSRKSISTGVYLSDLGHCLMENSAHCWERLPAQRSGGGQ